MDLLRTLSVSCVAAMLSLSQACDDSTGDCGFGTQTFVAYDPGAAVAAIPLCNAGDASAPGVGELPGSSALSEAGVSQCEAICTQSAAALPCCVSMWEPNTVVCSPCFAP